MNELITVHGIALQLEGISDLMEFVVNRKDDTDDERFCSLWETLLGLLDKEIEKLLKLSEPPL